MSFPRFETIVVNRVARTIDVNGEEIETLTPYNTYAARFQDLRSKLKLQELYRLYGDFLEIWLNWTPDTLVLSNEYEDFSIYYGTKNWRIIDAIQSDDRMTIRLIAYFASPTIKV